MKFHRLLSIALTLFPGAWLLGQWEAGTKLPDLSQYALEGSLPDDLDGKVVLVDFWASWCPPCRMSFGAMAKLQDSFVDSDLRIVAISVDESGMAYRRFLEKFEPPFPTAWDSDQRLVADAGIATMPTSFLIDRSGRVRSVHYGFHPSKTEPQLREEISNLLSESK